MTICEDWETLLPTSLNRLFVQEASSFEKTLYNQICAYGGIQRPRDHFSLLHSDEWAIEQMASNPVTVHFLQFLVRSNRINTILEIGTFIGLTTLYLAEALPPSGRVTTIEAHAPFARLAQANFEENHLAHMIDLIHDDALAVLNRYPGHSRFDMIFIDGNKERYDEYLRLSVGLLSEQGTIVIDNVFICGDAMNAVPKTAKGCGGKRLLEQIKAMDEWHRTFVPFHDGVFILQRKQTY